MDLEEEMNLYRIYFLIKCARLMIMAHLILGIEVFSKFKKILLNYNGEICIYFINFLEPFWTDITNETGSFTQAYNEVHHSIMQLIFFDFILLC
jgi:hypothetical protein